MTWLPVLIFDRIKLNRDLPGECIFYTVEDKRFGIFFLTIGYPIPFTLMVVCNIKVYYAVQKSKASVKPHARSGSSNTTSTAVVKSTIICAPKTETSFQIFDAATTTTITTTTTSHQGTSGSLERGQTTTVTPGFQKPSDVEKIFRSLCTVVGAYLVLWLPCCITQSVISFYTLSDLLLDFLIATNILAYSNSAVNPFLYAIGSNDFRLAFKRMFRKVRCCR